MADWEIVLMCMGADEVNFCCDRTGGGGEFGQFI